jgi:SOS response regulatory protein OraA/RecX
MTTRTTNKSDYSRALDLLTRYLALRDHSRFELEQKLGRKFERELVERVLNEAAESGWITPDAVIAERTLKAYQARLKSRRYIEGQLRKKRLPVPQRDSAGEFTVARELLERKFGPAKELSFDDKGKAYRFMKYRGFDDRTIRMVLSGQEPEQ